MSIKKEICDDLVDSSDDYFELNQVVRNYAVDCDPFAQSANLENSESCRENVVKVEPIITDDGLKVENGIFEDEWKPFLYVDVKDDYSVNEASWLDHDPLLLSPQNKCPLSVEEELNRVNAEFTEKPKSNIKIVCVGEPTTFQPCIDLSVEHGKSFTRTKRKFQCRICSKVFFTKYNLIMHYRVHTGEKPFKCSTCDKAFSQKCSLVDHCRIHTDEKLFKCNTCSKTFNVKSNLVQHCRRHADEKLFKCPTCYKEFGHKISLVNHCKTHSHEKPYKCFNCSKAFRQKCHLTQHCRLHTGEKPFKCTTCSIAFSVKYNLIQHSRIHTGEKPFKCNTCSKAFNQKCNLLKHCRIHTG